MNFETLDIVIGILGSLQVWQLAAVKGLRSDISELREMFFDHIEKNGKIK